MIKRELKVNFKSFTIWLIVICVIYGFVYLMYPSITSSQDMQKFDEMMKLFPKELLQAFNMDLSSINSAYGWLKSEGFVMLLLAIGCYSSILGGNIILKEENDKTIEYLNTLPVSRTNIVLSKTLVGLFYIIILTLLLLGFNYIGLSLIEEFNIKEFILLSLTPLLSSIPIYFISIFIGTFAKKTKQVFGLNLGIVLLSYIFNAISVISKEVEFLKYFSVYTLADIRNVIINNEISIIMILISLSISVILFILSIINYNRKELV